MKTPQESALQSPQAEMPGLPEPDASYHVSHFRQDPGMRNTEFQEATDFAEGSHHLYTRQKLESYGRTCAAMQDSPTARQALEAIRPFVAHADSCGDMDAYNNSPVQTCGCGLDSALELADAAMQAGGESLTVPANFKLGETIYTPPSEDVRFCYTRGQPDNVNAWRLGEACRRAADASAGDYIDRGLVLLKELEARGYGVFRFVKGTAPQAPAVDDTKRLDWLAHHGVSIRQDPGTKQWFLVGVYHMGNPAVDDRKRAATAREAIDAALTAQKEATP